MFKRFCVLMMSFFVINLNAASLEFNPRIGDKVIYHLETNLSINGVGMFNQNISEGNFIEGPIEMEFYGKDFESTKVKVRSGVFDITHVDFNDTGKYKFDPVNIPLKLNFDRRGQVSVSWPYSQLLEKIEVGNASISGILRASFPEVPAREVRVEDSWTGRSSMTLRFKYQHERYIFADVVITSTYKLESINGSIAKISGRSKIKVYGKTNPEEAIYFTLSGSGEGTSSFDFLLDKKYLKDYHFEYEVNAYPRMFSHGKEIFTRKIQLKNNSSLIKINDYK